MESAEAAINQPNDEYEEKNVHEVYQQIANHFSATRYKVSTRSLPRRSRYSLPGSYLPILAAMANCGTVPQGIGSRCDWVGRGMRQW